MSVAAAERTRTPKADPACVGAVDLARAAAEEVADAPASGDALGEYLGHRVEGERLVTHRFATTDPAYQGWHWSVTVARASRAKDVTVNEIVLLPGDEALRAPAWVPWADRVEAGDIAPGVQFPTPAEDPRLVPGYTAGEDAADADPAEQSQLRAVVAELGLGRERLLSAEGRDQAAERWYAGDGGPDNQMTQQAPGNCVSCGYFVKLAGSMGTQFGVCANVYSPSDGRVVSLDHGCGGHSDVVEEQPNSEPAAPVWDSVSWDSEATLFE
ncbi:DUF3027 domain-containing protein [Propionibacteriaceae bacterium Y2011]